MKKFLTILNSIAALFVTIATISCKKPNVSTINKTRNNDNVPNNIISRNEKDLRSDDSSKMNDRSTKLDNNSDKKNKQEDITNEFKEQISKMIKSREFEQIKNLAQQFIYQNSLNLLERQAEKKIKELNERILKLFSESNFDQIRTEIAILISNNFNNNKVTEQERKNITELLDQVSEENKDKILTKINELFANIFRNEFKEHQDKLTNEINKLIDNQEYDKLTEKLLSLANKKSS
ncbi:lipoprotein [Mycoplasma feriruminatoris]|uniref:Lipoprotein n=1 Tax=Mycoplasma feriruminatoris TaxID=1179777 RepID=A0ABY8HVD0_9MOLU|nr:hypothetical protein [Mycoplasma feriruminatoris]WFQ93558.1 lipoprotein [Mycoplasma feriruminatoris]